jgi:hypothetical protein
LPSQSAAVPAPTITFIVLTSIIALTIIIPVTIILFAAIIRAATAHPPVTVILALIAACIFLPDVARLIFTTHLAFVRPVIIVILIAVIRFAVFPVFTMAGAMTVLALAAAGILITSAVIAITGYQITAKIGILITIIPVSGTIVVIPIQRAHIPVIAPFLGIITQTALDTGVVTVAVPRGDLGGIGPANHVGATGIIISVVISGHRTLLIA